MSDPKLDLIELRRLVDAMTPAPWRLADRRPHVVLASVPQDHGLEHAVVGCNGPEDVADRNAAGIVALRNAAPELLARIDRQSIANDRLAGALGDAMEEIARLKAALLEAVTIGEAANGSTSGYQPKRAARLQELRDLAAGATGSRMANMDNLDVLATLPDGRAGYCDGFWLWTSTGTTIHHRDEAEEMAASLRAMYPDVTFTVVAASYADPYEVICSVRGDLPHITGSGEKDGTNPFPAEKKPAGSVAAEPAEVTENPDETRQCERGDSNPHGVTR